ncbi:hypothetical protein CGCTS75_v001382 [Colletotrichum tropicale]|nr:hypothetical protein CGCTS75_v001382 [Colletotrichum tropicale]
MAGISRTTSKTTAARPPEAVKVPRLSTSRCAASGVSSTGKPGRRNPFPDPRLMNPNPDPSLPLAVAAYM